IMDHVAPDGPVYQAGTLSGNPVAMTAGLKTLELISEPGFFDRLATRTRQFAEGLSEVCKRNGIGVCVQYVGGMFGVFFTDRQEVTSFAQVMDCDVDRFKAFFHACLKEGVYLAPSAFEAGFVSAAHSESVIEATLAAAERACRQIR
ncbi:MAG: aminotransferase class III-fold pyridoxal phosphate-dependent enzyme, partial [Gammaproteobacteria bacterium]|nr:aminotransferase class III-fold pyridoxal phosphate-dependent enzyme [Gammaproteobacteria bacterium]